MTTDGGSPHARAASRAGRILGSALFWLGALVACLGLLVGVGLPALFLAVLAVTDPPPDPGDGRANAFGGVVIIAGIALVTLIPAGVVLMVVGAVVAWLGDGLALWPVGRVTAWVRVRCRSAAGRVAGALT